uniref:Uncharacterized protein n=1 Tax=Acrobeloides nanus TaxID=290746 RepID=A0A914DAQ2_9BILA
MGNQASYNLEKATKRLSFDSVNDRHDSFESTSGRLKSDSLTSQVSNAYPIDVFEKHEEGVIWPPNKIPVPKPRNRTKRQAQNQAITNEQANVTAILASTSAMFPRILGGSMSQ